MRILSLFLMFVFSVVSHAQGTVNDEEIRAITARVNEIDAEYSRIYQQSIPLRRQVEAIERRLKQDSGADKDHYLTANDLAAKEAFDQAKAKDSELQSLYRRLQPVNDKFEQLRRESESLRSKSRNLGLDQLQAFQNKIAKLSYVVLATDVNLLNAKSALDNIQDEYDKTVLGAYLRDKLGQVLGSDTFCKAQTMCNEPIKAKRMDVVEPSLKEELFKSQVMGTRSQQQIRPTAK